MTIAKSPQFKNFEEYLAAQPGDLPDGRYEYWDGELVPVMTESIGNDGIANYLMVLLMQAGIALPLLRPGKVEVVVPGRPRTRFPDFVLLDEMHLNLLEKRATITLDMPPPRLLAEVVSPGDEKSENYQRDYEDKPQQYAAIEVPEYWIIDPERRLVLVGVLANGDYQFSQFMADQPIESPTLSDLRLTVKQILGLDSESAQ